MRRMGWLALLWGCGPDLQGWWSVERLHVAAAGGSDARDDAGYVVFDEYGAMDVALRYTIDPAGPALVPDPEAVVQDLSTEFEPTPVGEPDLSATTLSGVYVELDLVEYGGQRCVLRSDEGGVVVELTLAR